LESRHLTHARLDWIATKEADVDDMEVKVLWDSLELWVFIDPLDLSDCFFLHIVEYIFVIDPSSRIDRMPIVITHSIITVIGFLPEGDTGHGSHTPFMMSKLFAA